MTVRWLAERIEDGERAARVGRDGDRLVAEWTGLATLSVARDGTDVVFDARADAPRDAVTKLQAGMVPLLLAHLEGKIPLHASAVAIEGRAVAFVGASGHGKSTLAASLCDLHGASLLGDDGVLVERAERKGGYRVVALQERHWLDADAARALGREDLFADKAPLAPRRADVASAPLVMIAHLVFADIPEPRLVPVRGLAAVGGLLAQLTRLVVDDPVVARRDLTALADLVSQTHVVCLERPRRLEQLQSTATLIAATVEGMP